MQLAEWLTVSPTIALAIIAARTRGGAYMSKEDLLNRVSAAKTKAVRTKIEDLLVTEEEQQAVLSSVARFTNGLLCWHDLRKISQPPDVLSPRMEFAWDAVSMLRRKILLYLKTKTYVC